MSASPLAWFSSRPTTISVCGAARTPSPWDSSFWEAGAAPAVPRTASVSAKIVTIRSRLMAWRTLHAELLAGDPADFAAVRTASGLAHHVADDRPDRLLLAGADLVGGVGVGVDRLLNEPVELVAVPHPPRALGVDDRRRLAALGGERLEHGLGRARRDLLAPDHADEVCEPVRRHLRLRGICAREDAAQIAHTPLGELLRVATHGQRLLEPRPQALPEGEDTGGVGRQAERLLVAPLALGGQLGQGRAGALHL